MSQSTRNFAIGAFVITTALGIGCQSIEREAREKPTSKPIATTTSSVATAAATTGPFPVELNLGDYDKIYSLKRDHGDGPVVDFNVLAFNDDSIFATGKNVALSASAAVSNPKASCEPVTIFTTNDTLKVVETAAGGKDLQLNLQLNSGVPISRPLTSGGSGMHTLWMRTVPLNGSGDATADPDRYDFYIMLVDANPGSTKKNKHFRVEAFPASSWDPRQGCAKTNKCDCGRPDAAGVVWGPQANISGDYGGQTHSGEGDEPK